MGGGFIKNPSTVVFPYSSSTGAGDVEAACLPKQLPSSHMF